MELEVGELPVIGALPASGGLADTHEARDAIQWYRFTIEEKATYVIDVKADHGDPVVGLFRARGIEYIAENDDGGQQIDARLEWLLEQGTYYAGVREFLGKPARYWISVGKYSGRWR